MIRRSEVFHALLKLSPQIAQGIRNGQAEPARASWKSIPSVPRLYHRRSALNTVRARSESSVGAQSGRIGRSRAQGSEKRTGAREEGPRADFRTNLLD
jgi:hypothetical protein